LFRTEDLPYQAAENVGFTHLIGSAKSNRLVAHRLESRVRRDFPNRASRVDRLLS
jgi:hypothetical protein